MELPIGIFDSGLGGLSVAARILDELPNENIIYLADNAHVPYGERPIEEVRSFAVAITGYLIKRGAKVVVMACNMSSAIALDAARQSYPDVPVIGVIEPGAAAAVKASDGKSIGVLATTGTVKSNAYVRSISAINENLQVLQQACPRFVPLIESGNADSEDAEAAACTYASPLVTGGCETVILGCTHYPFVKNAIRAAVGKYVTIVDPAFETTVVLKDILKKMSALNKSNSKGEHVFCATGDTEGFGTLGSNFLGRKIDTVESVIWGIDIHCDSLDNTPAKSR